MANKIWQKPKAVRLLVFVFRSDVLSAELQSKRMPKVTNDDLTQSDTATQDVLLLYLYENSGRQRVNFARCVVQIKIP